MGQRDGRITPERGRPCRVTCILGSRSDGGTRISSGGSQSSRLGRSMDITDSSSSHEDCGMVNDCWYSYSRLACWDPGTYFFSMIPNLVPGSHLNPT